MSTTKSINATIAGQNYSFTVSEKDEAALMQAVKVVDTEMSRIRASTQAKSQERIAVMAAIRFAADLLILRNSHASDADKHITAQLNTWSEHINHVLRDYEQI